MRGMGKSMEVPASRGAGHPGLLNRLRLRLPEASDAGLPKAAKEAPAVTARRIAILAALFTACCLIYYWDQLAAYVGWGTGSFFDVPHDIHRLFFIIPLIYAGHVLRIRGAVAVATLTLVAFIPRALFISTYPDPVLRAALFAAVAGLAGTFTGVIRNEFERRTRLRDLVRSERDKFLNILDTMEEGVFIVGPDFRVRFTNQSMVRDFGEGLGALCYDYLHKFDESCGEHCSLHNVLNGSVESWEYSLPNGVTYEVIASPFADSDGRICMLCAFRNITRRKQVETELVELNTLKSELVSNVSHELRSPLTSIKGIISSLLQKDVKLDPETRDMFLQGMSEETDRLSSLVTNLLDMSRLEAGAWNPEIEEFDIADLINEAVERQRWFDKSHVIETDVEKRLPGVRADYSQIRQVLVNLLENSAAYSPEGTHITVRAGKRDGKVQVSISDQGVGIAGEDLERIFEKFYRGGGARQKPGGMGLGLAICKAIVQSHGGDIWAESEAGPGSVFAFTLPAAGGEEGT